MLSAIAFALQFAFAQAAIVAWPCSSPEFFTLSSRKKIGFAALVVVGFVFSVGLVGSLFWTVFSITNALLYMHCAVSRADGADMVARCCVSSRTVPGNKFGVCSALWLRVYLGACHRTVGAAVVPLVFLMHPLRGLIVRISPDSPSSLALASIAVVRSRDRDPLGLALVSHFLACAFAALSFYALALDVTGWRRKDFSFVHALVCAPILPGSALLIARQVCVCACFLWSSLLDRV